MTGPVSLPYVTTGYAQVLDADDRPEPPDVTFQSIADLPRFGAAVPMWLSDGRMAVPMGADPATGFVRWRVEDSR